MEATASGAEQLKEWIARAKLNQRKVADLWGWDEVRLSRFVNGVRTPDVDAALFIQEKTGIPVAAWASSRLDESQPAQGSKRGSRKVLRTGKRHVA